ncbi:MAG: hypothetical protein ABJE95_07145 [Byssovorax sp.]
MALFLNGVFEAVLKEVRLVQDILPEHIMFLQPHKGEAIAKLREDPPSVDDPMLLLMSLTDDLPNVCYVAEIVGWDDKRAMAPRKWHMISRLIWILQPKEGGLYNASHAEGKESVNLLHVRRLRKLATRVSVTKLMNVGDGQPLSDGRTTSGGWIYVKAPSPRGLR